MSMQEVRAEIEAGEAKVTEGINLVGAAETRRQNLANFLGNLLTQLQGVSPTGMREESEAIVVTTRAAGDAHSAGEAHLSTAAEGTGNVYLDQAADFAYAAKATLDAVPAVVEGIDKNIEVLATQIDSLLLNTKTVLEQVDRLGQPLDLAGTQAQQAVTLIQAYEGVI